MIQDISESDTFVKRMISSGELIATVSGDLVAKGVGEFLDTETVWGREIGLSHIEDDASESEMAHVKHGGVLVNNPMNFKTTESYLIAPLTLHGIFSIHFQVN